MLIPGSKDKQNKRSLLAFAFKYRLNSPCSNRIAALRWPCPTDSIREGNHNLNECIYNTLSARVVPETQGEVLVLMFQPAVPSGGEMETPGHRGQVDREAGNSCCKCGVREGGLALKKEEEGMKEEDSSAGTRTNHQVVLRQANALL